jgi:UDP-N-acetylmuramoylalanine--D-glutamate ligase
LFGLGGSGMATARALLAGGARVTAWDDNAERARARAGAGHRSGRICARPIGRGFAALVLSPGVPLTHPAPHWSVEKAREAGSRSSATSNSSAASGGLRAGCPFIAITGTNGKSTTTALIAHILRPRAVTCRWAAISARPC